jgi:hypothetical protein
MRDFSTPYNSLMLGNTMYQKSITGVTGFTPEAFQAMSLLVRQEKLWDPSRATLELWLDAADASSVTLVNGLVSVWADKSGNARHAQQGSESKRPVHSDNGIVFTNDLLVVPVSAYPLSGFGYTLTTLYTSSATGSTSTGLININSSPSDDPEFRIGVGTTLYDYYNGTYAFNALAVDALNLNILTVSREAGITTTAYKNDIQIGSATIAGTLSSLSEFSLGSYARISGYRNGTIRELIVHQNSTQLRQMIVGYLAHKWDKILGNTTLVSALHSTHPYKYFPPLV